LTLEEWLLVKAALPPRKPKIGRPGGDLRQIVNGILWVQCTGGSWRSMPSRYGPWPTIASRYHRWKQAGIWDRVQAIIDLRK
jgi:transposase